METFRIARDFAWRLPLLIIGATEARSLVTLDDEAVDIQFGFTKVRIPYTNVRGVSGRDWSWLLGIGIRIAGDKTLGLIGSTQGVVQIALREPMDRGGLILRHPRNVAVSLDDPNTFMTALESRLPTSYRD
ncbi:MAG: hypothetical protein JNK04_06255 [Myxococcales bacterium]|nr:hypothetical protein [Myxococcales bacterium]